MSLVSFLVYGWDKRAAKMDGRRVPEKTLHLLAFFCGWPGAIFGQSFWRHKTQKPLFKSITYLIGALHLIVLGVLSFQGLMGSAT
jgi:uncharacterized membrane protein YsdA (DUF1294 family)